ncbi:hypothetical protein [Flavobacterium sp.]
MLINSLVHIKLGATEGPIAGDTVTGADSNTWFFYPIAGICI